MSRESHEEFLKRSAKRALSKARERRQKEQWSVEEVRELKIQTVETWKRFVFAILGVGAAIGSFIAFNEGATGLGVLLVALSLVLIVVAAFGRKNHIETVLDSVNLLDLVSGIVDIF